MSEKILACLLRLYPARFRRRYQAEAIQLLRDRMRDESGALRRLRLWMDVLVDLLRGMPAAYRNTYATAAVPRVAPSAAGIPAFASLDEEPLKPGSILLASVLAVGALALSAFLMSLVSPYGPFSGASGRLSAAPNGPEVQSEAKTLEAQEQAVAQMLDCGFDRLGVLPGNVGYVRVSWLADPAKCQGIVQRVARRLNQDDAIILDLRTWGAGNLEMEHLFASSIAAKPIFVLVSPQSTPAAGEFARSLKTHQWAAIVGERGSLSGRGGSPRPATVFESSGVEPDVEVNAAEVVPAAEKLALAALHRN